MTTLAPRDLVSLQLTTKKERRKYKSGKMIKHPPAILARNNHILLSLSQHIPDTGAQTPRNALPIPVRVAFLNKKGKIVPTKLAKNSLAQDEHVIMLKTSQQEQSIYAPKVQSLTPSILRNFSAPVVVDDDLSTDERHHIMRYDTDLFNRWDSAQTLVTEEILTISPTLGLTEATCELYFLNFFKIFP